MDLRVSGAGIRRCSMVIGALLVCAAVVAAAADVPNPVATPIPVNVGVPLGPVNAAPVDLALFGYAEQEFQVSGSANTYAESGTWASDGKWAVNIVSSGHSYTTRILVRRPVESARFNGTVVVEWLNATSGYDLDVDWPQAYQEFVRDGFAWVGVSAQKIGVTALAGINPARYGKLTIPSDDNSYDIFSQVAVAIRQQSGLILGGLHPERIIATGQSQSAIRLVTYTNAIQPIAHAFDALMLHSRSSGAAPISGLAFPPSVVYIRDDLGVPVLQLESQTDVGELAFYKARQPDTAGLRSWEVAGASHVDATFLTAANSESANALGAPLVSCVWQVNSVPFTYVEDAAWSALNGWLVRGKLPPSSPPIAMGADGKVQLDQYGNAVGGIRLPELEVPIATYGPNNLGRANSDVPNGLDYLGCALLGSTVPLKASLLKSLYPTHDDYVTRYQQAAQALVQQGFMLPQDESLAVQRAQQSKVGG
jgi:hypothetical protein